MRRRSSALAGASAATSSLRRRVLGTLAPAALGCALGFYYAQAFVPEAASQNLYGMYATIGAVIAIMTVRVGSILWMIVADFLGRAD